MEGTIMFDLNVTEIGSVNVSTSDNGGLSDEQIAQIVLDKIVLFLTLLQSQSDNKLLPTKKILGKFYLSMLNWQKRKSVLVLYMFLRKTLEAM